MIFRNQPAGPSIKPGMGYAGGADRLGYVAHMGYAGGAYPLGAVSTTQMQKAIDQGLDASTLTALSAAGATDSDIAALMVGDTDVPTLMAKYAGLKTTEGTTVTYDGAAPSSSGAAAAQVPSGTTLLYAVTWTAGIGNLSVSTDKAISNLANGIATHGLSLISGQASDTGPIHYGIQVTILDTIGNALLSDAKSVLDAVMQTVVGNNLSGSSLSIVSSPGQNAGGAPQPASGALAWLENNALYIALGLGGLVLLNNFTGKRR